MRYIGEFSHQLPSAPLPGQKVVVRTDRGVEMAQVVVPVSRNTTEQCGPRVILGEKLNEFIKTAGGEFPFRRTGKVLRLANQQDEVDFRHLAASARDEIKYCRKRIKEARLQMKVVTAEHLLGGGRIIYYFIADKRVDFRELVRDLASQFRTRIEMRQVGARDEARLVGDYERCGQMCCCRGFLKLIQPVSMRMAKVQKATLDPAKISGRCGRLMCCLRYDDEAYTVLRKNLPRRNTWARTQDYLGKVADVQIITQLVRLLLPDGTSVAVGVDELVERNMEPPTEDQLRQASARHAAIRRNAVVVPGVEFNFNSDDEQKDQAAAETCADDVGRKKASARKHSTGGRRDKTSSRPTKRRRRRRRKK
jgi:cell fate regulator YaaT (PSP1 superfamily)